MAAVNAIYYTISRLNWFISSNYAILYYLFLVVFMLTLFRVDTDIRITSAYRQSHRIKINIQYQRSIVFNVHIKRIFRSTNSQARWTRLLIRNSVRLFICITLIAALSKAARFMPEKPFCVSLFSLSIVAARNTCIPSQQRKNATNDWLSCSAGYWFSNTFNG